MDSKIEDRIWKFHKRLPDDQFMHGFVRIEHCGNSFLGHAVVNEANEIKRLGGTIVNIGPEPDQSSSRILNPITELKLFSD